MSSNELKAKLLKQKNKDSKKVTVISQERKKLEKTSVAKKPKAKEEPKFFPKTEKHLKQRSSEEDFMRNALKTILEKYSNEEASSDQESRKSNEEPQEENIFQASLDKEGRKFYDKETKDVEDGKEWIELPISSKRDFILQALDKDPNALFGRQQFLNKFIHLSQALQNDFITRYLAQSKNYTEFWEHWSQQKDIAGAIQEFEQTRDKMGNSEKNKMGEIYEEIRQKLLEYAQDKGLEIEDKPLFSDIMSQVSSKPTKQKKIYLKIAKDYIDLANILGIPNPENLSLGELSAEISQMDKRHSVGLDKDIQRMSTDTLIKRAEMAGFKNASELPRRVLFSLVLFDESKSRKVAPPSYAILIREAGELGIPVTETDTLENRVKLRNRISMMKEKTLKEKRKPKRITSKDADIAEEMKNISSMLDRKNEELSNQSKRKDREKTPRMIQLEKEIAELETQYATLKRQSILGSGIQEKEKDQRNLAMKLSRITGFPPSHYQRWSLKQLEQRYQAMEDGEEYWQDFKRETVIEALMDTTGKKMESFADMTTEQLLEELEKIERMDYVRKELPGKVKATSVYTLKCLENFQQYKWITAKVTGVWIADPFQESKHTKFTDDGSAFQVAPENIQEYAYNGHILVDGKSFFQANRKFFHLQCNQYSKKRVQDGDILTCYDSKQEPVKFIVGYTISGNKTQMKPYKEKSSRVASGELIGERFIIQDEEMFELELQALEKISKTKEQHVTEILSKHVTPISIQIASKYLSSALLQVNPKNKDYVAQSPYIQIAINSILTGPDQTVQQLYYAVANVITYLNIEQCATFRKRVSDEYYLPETLMILSSQDKFPEVFDPLYGASEKTVNTMISHIRTITNMTVREMGLSQYQIMNPTVSKATAPKIDPIVANLEYDDSVCVNKAEMDKVPRENIVFYRDLSDGKTYCFDVEKLVENFNKLDFNNPHTGNKFSKEFIRRYTISYYDYITNTTYTFPFEKLYKQLKGGDTVNKKTGTPFDPKFVSGIVKGITFPKSLYERERKFRKLDLHASKCQNPQDIVNEPIETVVYYRDPESDELYCFSIPKLAVILNETGTNPYTGKEFSKKFVKKFNSMFSMALHEKGLLQPEFRERYGKDLIPEINDKKEEKDKLVPPEKLIVPNLWKLVTSDLEKLGGEKDDKEESREDDEASEEVEDEDDEDEEDEDEDENEDDEDDEEDVEDEASEEVEDNGKDKQSEESSEKESEKVKKKNKSKSSEEFGFPKTTTKCDNCKKVKNIFSSVIMIDNKAKIVGFCSTNCMEKYDFPKYKGKKAKKCKKKK